MSNENEAFDAEGLRTFYRCPDCKATFDEPEDDEGNTPSPISKVACPECYETWSQMFYIKLYGTTPENACNPPIVKEQTK